MQIQNRPRQIIISYSFALGAVLVCTLLCLPLRGQVDAISLTMVYLAGVVIAAARLGIGPAIFTSFLSVLAFNFFFTKPYHSFEFYDASYYFTFSVMLITSLIVGSMTAQLSRLLNQTRDEERETHALYDLARGLSELKSKEEILEFSKNFIGEFFDDICVITDKVPNEKGRQLYDNISGSMIIETQNNDTNQEYSKNDIIMHRAFAGLVSSALARAEADEQAALYRFESDNEHLRNMLLSSLAHDLRTPLTILNGTLSNLFKHRKNLPREGVNDLTSMAQQLNRLQNFVANSLRMASISSGAIKLNRETYIIQEIIGAAITRIEPQKENRKILSSINGIIPMVSVDGAMMEQVMFNIFDNAIKHTTQDGEIRVKIANSNNMVEIAISDNGDGIREGSEQYIFDKFYSDRERQQNNSGTGLGLAICKAIVNAHGGTISAINNVPPQKGATFKICLPVERVIDND
jgi:two-component system sensor histidine kinase KdpD